MNMGRIVLGLLGIVISGCVVTTTTRVVEMDRLDQQLSDNDNRGYLTGKPSEEEMSSRKTTRQVIRTDIELPTISELQRPPTKDEELDGNRGYLQQKGYQPAPKVSSLTQEFDAEMEAAEPAVLEEDFAQEAIEQLEPIVTAESQTAKEPVKETLFEEYVIQKGDTLQSIAAKPNVYGKSSKWVKIYDANKDVIKNPNRVYPGLKIRIPKE